MTEMKYCTAVVTDINDENQQGKIQVRLLPYMNDAKQALLPWYDPLVGAGNSVQYEFNPPKVGSTIIVFPSSSTMRNGYYLGGDHIEGFFDYSAVKAIIDQATEVSSSDYPNVRFFLFNDGTVEFHNNETGDRGVVHSSGSYQIIDKDGNIYISQKDGNKISISNTGTIIKDSNNNEINFSSSGLAINDKNGNTVVMGTTSVKINNNLEVLQ